MNDEMKKEIERMQTEDRIALQKMVDDTILYGEENPDCFCVPTGLLMSNLLNAICGMWVKINKDGTKRDKEFLKQCADGLKDKLSKFRETK